MTVQRFPVTRLEQLLCLWEEACFMHGMRRRITSALQHTPCVIPSPYLHWRELRQHLLRTREVPFDASRFFAVDDATASELAAGVMTPLALFAWSKWRRVYKLDEEVQAVLMHTDLNEIRWMDVTYPFDSFAVQLAYPISDGIGEYDFILCERHHTVTDEGDFGQIGFLLVSGALDHIRWVDPFSMASLERAVRNKRWGDAGRKYQRLLRPDDQVLVRGYGLPEARFTASVRTSMREHVEAEARGIGIDPADLAIFDEVARIVVGLACYLGNLPSTNLGMPVWRTARSHGPPDPKSISHGAEVCTVASHWDLDPRVRQAIVPSQRQHAGAEQSAKAVRGHWRRAPGQGSNPTANKTVQVLPYIRNEDMLMPGELLGGSIHRT